jgi:hypothetical protein
MRRLESGWQSIGLAYGGLRHIEPKFLLLGNSSTVVALSENCSLALHPLSSPGRDVGGLFQTLTGYPPGIGPVAVRAGDRSAVAAALKVPPTENASISIWRVGFDANGSLVCSAPGEFLGLAGKVHQLDKAKVRPMLEKLREALAVY